jgi:hypothetical protein
VAPPASSKQTVKVGHSHPTALKRLVDLADHPLTGGAVRARRSLCAPARCRAYTGSERE